MKLKLRGEIRRDVPLSRHTWMQTGGSADYFATPCDLADLVSLLKSLESGQIPWFVIGEGTNVLFSDDGFRGCVLQLGEGFQEIRLSGERVHAGGAAKLGTLVRRCADESLSGMEELSGIPGSVGGAASTNAGAFGSQFTDTVVRVSGVDRSGNRTSLRKKELDFSYRKIVYPVDLVVTEVEFVLRRGSRDRSLQLIEECLEKRRERQPLGVPSAGCIFKNPSPDLSAGRLIDECGLKGKRVGDAMISEKHANFIVNTGRATTDEILSLIELVVDEVHARTGIALETEVEVVR